MTRATRTGDTFAVYYVPEGAAHERVTRQIASAAEARASALRLYASADLFPSRVRVVNLTTGAVELTYHRTVR